MNESLKIIYSKISWVELEYYPLDALMPTSPASSGKVLLKQNQISDATVAMYFYRMESWYINPYQ